MQSDLKVIKIFNYCYFIFLLFLFFSGISISVSQGLLILASVLFVIGLLKYRKTIKLNYIGLEKYILPFILISIFQSFLSPQILKNLDYIRDFWLISAFFLAYFLHNSKEDIKKTFYLLILIIILQSIIALIQMSLNISFINYAHEIGIFHYNSPDESIRIRGGLLGMHLTFSCYLMLIAMPVIYVSIGAVIKIKNNIRWILIITSVLSIVVLLITRTRSIIIALPFAVVPLLFINKKLRIFAALFLLFLMVFTSAILISRGQDKLSTQVNGNVINSESANQRIKIWKTAFHVWLKHPLIGAGGGNYLDEFRQVLKEHPEYEAGMVTHAHNDYLNQLARKGIIGFLAFIYMLYGIFKFFIVNLKYIKDKFLKYLYLGLFGAYCVFLVASLFQCFYTTDTNLVMLWFTIGLATAIAKIEKGNVEKNNNIASA
jgi:putative inorganic carbon (hco3(-)) transporter